MHSKRIAPFTASRAAMGFFAVAACTLAGCGNQYRPVVSSINPVGPAGQPTKYAVAISAVGPTTPGLVTLIDFAGDTILDTTAIGINPKYLMLDSGSQAYTLNGDGTLNSFPISTVLRPNDVLTTTLPAGSNPISLLPQGTSLYLAEAGRNAVAQLQGQPPAVRQELPSGAGTVYTVGIQGAPRVYGISQGNGVTPGTVAAIETSSNTVSSTLPVGIQPVYGVMTADSRRAFILNSGSNSVSVINAQSNAADTFTINGQVTGTIPVGVAPVWADFAPTLNELLVANAGNGTTPGSVSIINVALCSSTTVTGNPNCDPANPLDAVGFGQVIATIPVGINPVVIGVLQDGTRAYVANAGNAAAGIAGSVSVINLITNSVTTTIPAGASGIQSDAIVHGHPGFLAVTTGTPTGKVYITAPDSNDITILRTDTDAVQTHLSLQGAGVMVRTSRP